MAGSSFGEAPVRSLAAVAALVSIFHFGVSPSRGDGFKAVELNIVPSNEPHRAIGPILIFVGDTSENEQTVGHVGNPLHGKVSILRVWVKNKNCAARNAIVTNSVSKKFVRPTNASPFFVSEADVNATKDGVRRSGIDYHSVHQAAFVVYAPDDHSWPVSSYELLSREFNLFPHDFGLIGRAFSKSPSLPPQQSGGDSERERKEGRPDRSGKKRIIVVACALGSASCIFAIHGNSRRGVSLRSQDRALLRADRIVVFQGPECA
jgi:hypothetical protein